MKNYMIYLTSDTHFNHCKPFLYEARGFNTIQEHDEAIIERWNEVVRPNDTVYHLGDTTMGGDIEYSVDCVRRLNGQIEWILGNHDTLNRINRICELPHVNLVGEAMTLKYEKQRFFLSHYPTMTAPIGGKPFYKSLISLCGHTHTDNCFCDWIDYMIYHVEMDAHNCYPVSIEQIINDIRNECESL